MSDLQPPFLSGATAKPGTAVPLRGTGERADAPAALPLYSRRLPVLSSYISAVSSCSMAISIPLWDSLVSCMIFQ